MKSLINCILITMALGGCSHSDEGYLRTIEEWQRERLANLVKADGWATLAGLFPLRDSIQFFGSGDYLSIQFPDFAPDSIGYFRVVSDSVWMKTNPNHGINVNGISSHESLLTPADELQVCTLDRLQWFIIKRGSQFLVRLRDTEHPARKKLTDIPFYPIDEKWKFAATYHRYETPKVLSLPNALDMVIKNESPGYLSFRHNGQEYQMLAIEEGEELFLLFYDETSGTDTYGGGRYLYAHKPEDGEITILDFNKAYSPPCAFTEYATCLLPPSENRYPFAITAGEKDPHFLEH